jgi:hypothetical protein
VARAGVIARSVGATSAGSVRSIGPTWVAGTGSADRRWALRPPIAGYSPRSVRPRSAATPPWVVASWASRLAPAGTARLTARLGPPTRWSPSSVRGSLGPTALRPFPTAGLGPIGPFALAASSRSSPARCGVGAAGWTAGLASACSGPPTGPGPATLPRTLFARGPLGGSPLAGTGSVLARRTRRGTCGHGAKSIGVTSRRLYLSVAVDLIFSRACTGHRVLPARTGLPQFIRVRTSP